MRKITSLTALLSFLLLALTSIVLYISPQGRVAYWADWRLLGLTKSDWSALHINLGVLFLIAIGVHIYYNWKPILGYLKNRARELKIFTREFNIALVITLVVAIGSYLLLPPFNQVMMLSDSFKASASRTYGEPPYGHAELSSLQSFTGRVNMDPDRALERLREAGITVEGKEQQMLAIAKANDRSPQELYRIMKGETAGTASGGGLPNLPRAGLGRMTLVELAEANDLDLQKLVDGLRERGLLATADMPVKAVAEQNRMSPMDLYDLMKQITGQIPETE